MMAKPVARRMNTTSLPRQHFRRLAVILAMILTNGLPGQGMAAEAPLTLKPVDEAVQNPSFFAFRARLLLALARHDKTYLLSVIDPNIKNGFGGNDGIAEFQATWNLDSKDSKIWETLTEVLSLGGKFEAGGATFAAPYAYVCFPDELDAFEHVVVIGEKVRVRKLPSAEAEVVASVSWEIVKVAQDSESGEEERRWVKVATASGKTGYIAREFVRSPLDLRLFFENRAGRWLLTTMVSGD